jgi:hypothetical protein
MRRVLILVALLAVAASFIVVGGAGANNAAIVIHEEGGCILLDGDGNWVEADSLHWVIRKSSEELVCRVAGVPNSTGKAVIWNVNNTGILCYTGQYTDQWTETVSASGNATVHCHFDY